MIHHAKLPAIALLMLLSSFIPFGAHAEEPNKTYTIGVVPQFDARKLHGIWRPVLNRIEEKTGLKFNLAGTSSIPEFERKFMQGEFDFAYMNPYHLIIANKKAGYLPILRDHSRQLHGVLVARKDGNITRPEQLDGKRIAFPAPNALGASLLMRQELKDKFGINFTADYVKNHDSVYLNVLLGETSAGGGVQKTLNRQKDAYKSMLRIIHRTESVNSHPIVVLPGVPSGDLEEVRQAFLDMGKSKEDQVLLSKIPMREIGVASFEDYLPLNDMGLDRFYVAPQ